MPEQIKTCTRIRIEYMDRLEKTTHPQEERWSEIVCSIMNDINPLQRLEHVIKVHHDALYARATRADKTLRKHHRRRLQLYRNLLVQITEGE